MKKNFIIILLLVLSILIGCSIQSSDSINVNLAVNSTPIAINENFEMVILSKEGGSTIVNVELDANAARLLGITKYSVVYNNVQQISNTESLVSIEFSQLETAVQNYITDFKTNSSSIKEALEQISAAIDPTGHSGNIEFMISNNHHGNIVTQTGGGIEVVEVWTDPNGNIYIGIDTDGDGDVDYYIIITFNSDGSFKGIYVIDADDIN